MKQKRKFLPTAPYPKAKKKLQKVRKYDTWGVPSACLVPASLSSVRDMVLR